MSRSAHGLDSVPDHPDWRVRGACNNYDPDLWGSTESSDLAQAVWVCKWECPVRQVCHDWADGHRELVDQMVYGGLYWTRGTGTGTSRRRLPRPALYQPTPMRPTGRPARRRRPEIRRPRVPSAVPTPGPRCGENAGHAAHLRRSEPPCPPCTEAARAYRRGAS